MVLPFQLIGLTVTTGHRNSPPYSTPLRQVSTLTRSECFRQEAVFPNGFLHKLVAETDPEKLPRRQAIPDH
jgi:hypothetical protein